MHLLTGTEERVSVPSTSNTAVKFLKAGTLSVSQHTEQAVANKFNYY
jgi:hypothetical protein